MFTSIPVSLAVDAMYELLVKVGVSFDGADEFEKLVLLCTDKSRTCQFSAGLPIGGPLSSLIADVLMDRSERWILRFSQYSRHALLCYRYVDDVFCVWTGSDVELNLFLRDLNRFHENISFTLELGGTTLNYLDLTIQLLPVNIDDNCLVPVFSVFRKPTYTGVSIHQRSLHPTSHKFASLYAAINRMLSLPLSLTEQRRETEVIRAIAEKNCLPVNVPSLIKKLSLRRSLHASRSTLGFADFASSHYCDPPSLPLVTGRKREKWLRLPCLGRDSDRLSCELRRFGYRVGFYPLTRVQFLSSLKDSIPCSDSPGIYLLSCPCGDAYVSQTGRSLSKRFSEHHYAYNRLLLSKFVDSNNSSAMAQHCHNNLHPFKDIKVSLFHQCETGTRMNKLEEYYTISTLLRARQSNFNLLNDLDCVFVNPFIRFHLNFVS